MKTMLKTIVAWFVLYPLQDQALGFNWLARWYEHNGFYRFKVGQAISQKLRRGGEPMYFGYGRGEEARGWVVRGYTAEGDYIMDANGKEAIHFKWNVEHHFDRANGKGYRLPKSQVGTVLAEENGTNNGTGMSITMSRAVR